MTNEKMEQRLAAARLRNSALLAPSTEPAL